jgi:hypothetical protein
MPSVVTRKVSTDPPKWEYVYTPGEAANAELAKMLWAYFNEFAAPTDTLVMERKGYYNLLSVNRAREVLRSHPALSRLTRKQRYRALCSRWK